MPPPPPPPPPPAMPPPASASASASAIAIRFATYWILDALAGDESIDISVLQALLKGSSESLATAPEATRERVVLRSLQEASSLIPAGGDAAATAGGIRVGGAQSAEDVLFRLIREVEVSGTVETDLLPVFTLDIKETISTKKLTLPETSLQLLKGVDPWIKSMTPPSQLEHNGTEQCDNHQAPNQDLEDVSARFWPVEKDHVYGDLTMQFAGVHEVQQDTMSNLVNEGEIGNLQKDTSAATSVLHQEDTTDAVSLGTRSAERSPIVEGNMSVGSALASAGCDAHLEGTIIEPLLNQNLEDVSASIQPVEKDHVHGNLTLQSASVALPVSCNGANQVCKSATNLQPGTTTEDRMAFEEEEQNADKSHLEVSDANKSKQALHDGGSIMKNNMVHGGLTAQTAPVSQNCYVTLHDKTSEADCFSEKKNEMNRTDVQKDNCRTSIPSSSKDRDGESAKKTSNEENSEDTSPEICVRSKDQEIDDSVEDSSQEDLCIKCGKDGELLKCSDCLSAAHDRCFSSSVTFEETNLFYCPACRFKRAREGYQKAKTEYLEAKKNFIAFINTPQVIKQHDEQLNGVQPGAANRDGHSNGCDISKRTHENEAYNLAHPDEEPHQNRKKQKLNATGNGYPKEVLTEKVPASMDKHSELQNNRKTRVEGPEKNQQAGDKEACKEAGNDKPSHKRCDSLPNQDDEAGRKDSLPASNQTGGSDELGATSSNENDKRSLPPWRDMRHSKKRLQEKEPAGPSKSRKRISFRPQKRYSNPLAPPGRRKKLDWTEAEEDILREAMAKFPPQDGENISWIRILEYGRHVFDKTRTPMDLKDKWRNLKKKEQAGY